jgi:drug/metabolite transporter (DMT)-like permease
MTSRSMALTSARRPRAETLAYVGLGATTLAWAAAFIAGKVAMAEMTPTSAGALRYLLATALLLPFALRQRPAAGLGRSRGPLVVMVLCGGVTYQWLFLSALARTSATNTALLIAINPVLTLLLAPAIGEHVTRQRLGGAGLALVGAAAVITKGDLGVIAGVGYNTGDLLALAAAATWASFNLAARGVAGRLAPSFVNSIVYGVGALALLAIGGRNPWPELRAASPQALAAIFVMGAIASALAGQCFLYGVRVLGVGRTVVFIYLVPVLTAALSVLLLGERLALAQVAGGAAVLGGLYGTTRVRPLPDGA